MKLNIRSKLILSFLLVGLLPILLFGFLSTETLKSNLEAEAGNAVARTAEDKAQAFALYLDAQEGRTRDFASDGHIRRSVADILAGDPDGAKAAGLGEYLAREKQPLSPYIQGIFITDANGTIISATAPGETGKNESGEAYFEAARLGVAASAFEDQAGHFGIRQGIIVAAPLADLDTGERIGLLVNVFSREGIGGVLSTGSYSERSGGRDFHIFIVDENDRLIAHSSPEPSPEAYEQELESGLVDSCFLGQGNSSVREQHLGKEVFAASRCFPELGIVLIAAEEVDVALEPLESSYTLLAYAALFFSITIILFGLILSSTITRPVEELTETIEKISMGRLDAQIPPGIKDLGDEIGKLARSFDRTVVSLKLAMKETSPALRRQKELAEKALQESEERYRTIFEVAPVVIFTLSSDGKLTSLNPAFEKITGWGVREILGKDFLALVHPDDAEMSKREFRSLMEGGVVRPTLVRVLMKSGRYVVAEIVPRPIVKDGRVTGAMGVAHDLRERMLANEIHRDLTLLMESSAEAVLAINMDRKITSWNGGAEKLYGYSAKEAVGRDTSIFVPPEKTKEHLELVAMAARGERMEGMQTVRMAKGGKRIKVLLTVFPVKDADGKVVGAASISRPMGRESGKR
ncbi:MAG: PAS domain S-box protein [Candidatus Micrarchaeota archaeon]